MTRSLLRIIGVVMLLGTFVSPVLAEKQAPPKREAVKAVPAKTAPAAPKAESKAPLKQEAVKAEKTLKAAEKAAPAPKAVEKIEKPAPKKAVIAGATLKSAKKAAKKHGPNVFELFVAFLFKVVFFPILGFPLVVVLLIGAAVYFTVRMMFINIWGFPHAINIVRGKFDDPEDDGEISHFQALTSALSATVGLGNIAGVALAVGKGGAGAVFWMVVIGILGMTTKFVECTLAQMYRKVDADGTISGGPMYYLSEGLAKKGMGGFGKFLGGFFAICIIGAAFGGGNMFQANQSYELVASQVPFLAKNSWVFGIALAFLVGLVIIGGIKRIGTATSKIVPTMVALYVGASLFIILTNMPLIPGVFSDILTSAFSGSAMFGGVLGIMVIGISRAVFSNEAGIGSAAIAHSAAKTKYPVREGFVALLGPFIDTVVICTMTALVILITAPANPTLKKMHASKMEIMTISKQVAVAKGAAQKTALQAKLTAAKARYKGSQKGAKITSDAFTSVFSWFSILLTIAVFLFAYSTMISWSYYGEKGWEYLFGKGTITFYRVMFVGAVVLGSVSKLGSVLDFSDAMLFLCVFPNLIGSLLLFPEVRAHLKEYWKKHKNGEFEQS